jgi:hypothetical protein
MAKFSKKPIELLQSIDYTPPRTDWMSTPNDFSMGRWAYPAKPEKVEYLMHELPGVFANPREWSPGDVDWKLPSNWKDIVHEGFKERLDKYRSLKLFMDVCVRCGACADKCHFFIGSGDPKNMPVLRAELMRSVYRKDFTLAGKILGKLTGARVMEEDVLKEWFLYFYQCTECRRCSLFCPYGIDTAEVTMMARELLHLCGININWILEPVANCNRTGNHLGIQPHAFKDIVDFMLDDIETITGKRVKCPLNEKGHEVIFITPSGDVFADPGIYTFMGYLMLFDAIGLDFTMSTYASEGGNFGLFTNADMMKKLNAKMYAEANRLGAKWILGGECGHMWRVINQYMDTMNGYLQGPQMRTPVNPITGHGVQQRQADQDGAHRRVHRRPHQARQAEPGQDAQRLRAGHLPRLLQPRARHGHARRAPLRAEERLQPLLRNAREHHPRADLLLRGRFGPEHRRDHGDPPARRPAERQRPALRAGEARGEHHGLRLRHRPRHLDPLGRLLGPGRAHLRPA